LRFVFASTPARGHVNPILSVARLLAARGHEIVVTTGSAYRNDVEALGLRFLPLATDADLDMSDLGALIPGFFDMQPGPELTLRQLKRLFCDPMPGQFSTLNNILKTFPADAIVADAMFNGTIPMLLGEKRKRPAIIHYGFTYLAARRDDNAPDFMGLQPATSDAQRQRYLELRKRTDEALMSPLMTYLNQRLATLGVGPLDVPYFEALSLIPDLYIQPCVPGFEFPRRALPKPVHFVGALPILPSSLPDPGWIRDLDAGRRVVLVTQGTFSNGNLEQLLSPTINALADETDILVLATTGGRPLSALSSHIPSNVRLSEFIPYDRVLPKLDAVITNGGYGTVCLALRFGIPLVVSGRTEDKAAIAARVEWTGAGVNLATNVPDPISIQKAVRAVLDQPGYRNSARRLANEFSSYDTEREIVRLIEEHARREHVSNVRIGGSAATGSRDRVHISLDE
jgi:UDP:flavonoid glycosyltransferase YjiC (YdhE family)